MIAMSEVPIMSSLRLIACCFALAFSFHAASAAPAVQALGPGTAAGDERNIAMRLTATGTVLAVDPAARLMAVHGRRGTITFRLDPKVQNADQIRVGEQVQVDYVAAFLLARKRGTAAVRDAHRIAARRAPDGESLEDSYDRPIRFVTEILAVDEDNMTVRLRGSTGQVEDYPVNDHAAIAASRPGDYMLVSMNQAVAVGVTVLPRQ
jgi:hypothetical protein